MRLPFAKIAPGNVALRHRAMLAFAGFLALIALIVGLRLIALTSDPYRNLDWSSGLLTDEGFYLHNARNLVLFGHSRTDDFNNSLLSPTLNWVQIAVFKQFGAGIVQARLISVAAGLLGLPLFFAALRRAYNFRVAALAAVFLGLDHLPLLYGRMALMDTPAALVLIAALYAWVRAHPKPPDEAKTKSKIAPLFWLVLCGAALGLAFATRGLCAFAIPTPLFILARRRSGEPRNFPRLSAFVFGLASIIMLTIFFWMLPHRAELAQSNGFYLHQQLLPHSLNHFAHIVTRAFFGDTRGVAPALIRHTPALFALAIAGIWWRLSVRREREPLSETSLFLGGWLASGLIVFSLTGYSPSRYYILFFPALAAIAALTTQCASESARFILSSKRRRTLFGGFFAYHLFLFARPFSGRPGYIFVGVLTFCAALLFWFCPSGETKESKSEKTNPFSLFPFPFSLLLWALVNVLWLGDWLGHLAYTQRNAEQWLTANLPPDAVLIGDVAPGLSVNTGFVSVPVIPGLCNDNRPIERFAGRTRVIIILDGNRREAWWDKNYPLLVAPANRAAYFPDAVGFPVGVYIVPPYDAKNRSE